jgi:hypothetical protein
MAQTQDQLKTKYQNALTAIQHIRPGMELVIPA